MADALLQVKDLSKSFYGLRALSGVHLAVPEKSIVGLIGPNGCGKSTLFGCISGFIPADTGSVLFRGADIMRDAPHIIARKGLVRTFQNGFAPKRMTVIENMLLASRQTDESAWGALLGGPRIRRQQASGLARARELLRLIKLDHVENEYAWNLSGGQQKLLSLGRAIMYDADLVLLDEPAAGVHPTLIGKFMTLVRELRDNHGKTFLIIEHDMKFISGVCDHVVVLSAGRNLAEGPPAAIRKSPEVLEVYLGRRREPAH
jgi:ABC-type branched-subunit amino acid transport system ATPase component